MSIRQEPLHPDDEVALKVLLQYTFADTPTFDGLTESEKAIIGTPERFHRLVEWSCEGKSNSYATCQPLSIEGAEKMFGRCLEHNEVVCTQGGHKNPDGSSPMGLSDRYGEQ